MLFPKKQKGYFFEHSDHGMVVARTTATIGPMVVEEIQQCPVGDTEGFAAIKERFNSKKSHGAYLHAVCGTAPDSRIVRQVAVDAKRVKEQAYLNELVSTQIRVEADKYLFALLDAADGTDFDGSRAGRKSALVCGLPTGEITRLQDKLLELGVYPEKLELSSVAALGALIDYLAYNQIKSPTLVLEVGMESTQSFILGADGVEVSRPIAQGLSGMLPVVQKELGLKDEESAGKLFFSNAFDFTGMGPALVKKLLKELQSSIGFYEVQTGQSIGHVACTVIPPKLAWLETSIANQLGVAVLKPEMPAWLQSRGVTLSEAVPTSSLDARQFGLFGLMVNYSTSHHAVAS